VLCGVGYLDGETVSVSDEIVPYVFDLKPSYPNPFNPVTTIRFDVGVGDAIMNPLQLTIFDITGRLVETLVNGKLEPGHYEIQWNASRQPSGVYFLKMNSGSFVKTQKLILLK